MQPVRTTTLTVPVHSFKPRVRHSSYMVRRNTLGSPDCLLLDPSHSLHDQLHHTVTGENNYAGRTGSRRLADPAPAADEFLLWHHSLKPYAGVATLEFDRPVMTLKIQRSPGSASARTSLDSSQLAGFSRFRNRHRQMLGRSCHTPITLRKLC